MKNKIKKGMMVRVGLDLKESYSKFGRCSSGGMENMKGNLFPAQIVSGDAVKLYSQEKDFTYTFYCGDLIIDDNIEITYPEPEVFNPKQLFI